MKSLAWAFLAVAVAGAGCGAPRQAELKVLPNEKTVQPGPAASPEEVAGTVPPLRGLAEPRPLVPPELIPPDAPADPDPGFEHDTP